jgi:hypothetical protein
MGLLKIFEPPRTPRAPRGIVFTCPADFVKEVIIIYVKYSITIRIMVISYSDEIEML